VGLIGLRAFSWTVFKFPIVDQAVTYGAVGVVLIVESWLSGLRRLRRCTLRPLGGRAHLAADEKLA
jgi:hypothetical protein